MVVDFVQDLDPWHEANCEVVAENLSHTHGFVLAVMVMGCWLLLMLLLLLLLLFLLSLLSLVVLFFLRLVLLRTLC